MGYLPPMASSRVRKALWQVPLAVLALAPGWRGTLVGVTEDEKWARLRGADSAVGVSRPGEREGEEWHASYVDSAPARILETFGARSLLLRLTPPDLVAHMPVGARHADGYYRVESHLRWPWWWPGGGVDWTQPD